MQTLDVISVNAWSILLSLLNLGLLFLAAKKFLFRPVVNFFAEREARVKSLYAEAEAARGEQTALAEEYRVRMDRAMREAEDIVKSATDLATKEANEIVRKAEARAEQITQEARQNVERQREKMDADLRREIAKGAFAVAEKILEREVRREDHATFVADMIAQMEASDERKL